ncbi:DUF4760 domain-containing protein [Lysobacter terrae]
MERIFTDLKEGPLWAWFAALASFGLVLSLVLYSGYTPLWQSIVAFAAFAALCLFLGPTIIQSGKKGHKHVPTVCAWVVVLLLAFVVAFYYWYFRWVAPGTDQPHDRILNVVPVLTAVVAAGLGWFVHYQYSSKAHRTNNAFSMVMEMRKSSEFLKRQEIVVKHFPVTLDDIPAAYEPYFSGGSLRKLRTEIGGGEPTAEQKEALEHAEAISALKYLLNYYEFMSAGVKANDLDKDLLLDTVSEIVIGTYKRSQKLVKFVNDPKPTGQGQPLAYQCLKEIVADWDDIITQREADCKKGNGKR